MTNMEDLNLLQKAWREQTDPLPENLHRRFDVAGIDHASEERFAARYVEPLAPEPAQNIEADGKQILVFDSLGLVIDDEGLRRLRFFLGFGLAFSGQCLPSGADND